MNIIPIDISEWTLTRKTEKHPHREPVQIAILQGKIDTCNGSDKKTIRAMIRANYPGQADDQVIDQYGCIYQLADAAPRMDEISDVRQALRQASASPAYHWRNLAHQGQFLVPESSFIKLAMPKADSQYQGLKEAKVDLLGLFDFQFLEKLMLHTYKAVYHPFDGVAVAEKSQSGILVEHTLPLLAADESIAFYLGGTLAHMNKEGELCRLPENFTQGIGDDMYGVVKHESIIFVLSPTGNDNHKRVCGCIQSPDSTRQYTRFGLEETKFLLSGYPERIFD